MKIDFDELFEAFPNPCRWPRRKNLFRCRYGHDLTNEKNLKLNDRGWRICVACRKRKRVAKKRGTI